MAHSGTIFGAFGRFMEADKTSLSVSSDGLILIYKSVNQSSENRRMMAYGRTHCWYDWLTDGLLYFSQGIVRVVKIEGLGRERIRVTVRYDNCGPRSPNYRVCRATISAISANYLGYLGHPTQSSKPPLTPQPPQSEPMRNVANTQHIFITPSQCKTRN